jgi:hypothetical protein
MDTGWIESAKTRQQSMGTVSSSSFCQFFFDLIFRDLGVAIAMTYRETQGVSLLLFSTGFQTVFVMHKWSLRLSLLDANENFPLPRCVNCYDRNKQVIRTMWRNASRRIAPTRWWPRPRFQKA